jgi:hypothetical protein
MEAVVTKPDPMIESQVLDQVFRDPAEKDAQAWRVIYAGRLTTPTFNSRGAAIAYLSALQKGTRRPENGIPKPKIATKIAVGDKWTWDKNDVEWDRTPPEKGAPKLEPLLDAEGIKIAEANLKRIRDLGGS